MMDFVKFAHDRNRMCNVKRGVGEGCKGCPLDEIMDKKSVCSVWCFANPEKATEVVEQWADEHPTKNRQSEFLKLFPGAEPTKDGVLAICPKTFSPEYKDEMGLCKRHYAECDNCCREFWLAEVEDA